MSIACDIRNFFHDLFGSRLVARLEEDLLRLRQDFEERMREQNILIANLREERALLKAKTDLYELTIMPRASRMGAEVVNHTKLTKPNFSSFEAPPVKSRWEMVVEEHDKKIASELAEEAEAAKEKSNG